MVRIVAAQLMLIVPVCVLGQDSRKPVPDAARLSSKAEEAAGAVRDATLLAEARERSKELQGLKREADRLKGQFRSLEANAEDPGANAEDPGANATVGKFLCLVRGEWEKGLLMLAKGSDDNLKRLAEQELAKPTEAVRQAALGEDWAAQATKESGKYKEGAKARAAEWLERAIPGLTGLVRVSAQRTLASLGTTAGAKGQLTLDLGGVRMGFVYIKPGGFIMGSDEENDLPIHDKEGPARRVEIGTAFRMGKYEVTRGQFAAFVAATKHVTEAEKAGWGFGHRDGKWQEIPGLNWRNIDPAHTDEHPAGCIGWEGRERLLQMGLRCYEEEHPAPYRGGVGIRLPRRDGDEMAFRG